MELIPIPQEVVEKTVRTTKVRIIRQIRGKLRQKSHTRDDKTLNRTTLKMSEYIVNSGKFNASDVDGLIDDMHRSIIALKKRKQKLQQHKKRRN